MGDPHAWIVWSVPMTMLLVVLVVAVERGSRRRGRPVPYLRPLTEGFDATVFAEQFVDCIARHPDEACVGWGPHGVPVQVVPRHDVDEPGCRTWRVSVGNHTDVAYCHDDVHRVVSVRLARIEAERARVVTRG